LSERPVDTRSNLRGGEVGFSIDLAVQDQQTSGRYLLAIECDGASYHFSRFARDRDWSQQGHQQSLLKLHRSPHGD
jgi:hypothetical protein